MTDTGDPEPTLVPVADDDPNCGRRELDPGHVGDRKRRDVAGLATLAVGV